LSFLKNRWAILAMLLACWALFASLLAAYYWLQYSDFVSRVGGVLIYVNVGIDYGNSTRIFYNDTKALTGETLFDVTRRVATVEFQAGPYVTSINNVKQAGDYGWTYWVWNTTSSGWSIVWENADAYLVTNRETFLWCYENSSFLTPQ